MTGAKRQPLIFAALLFALSGAAALAYEIIWFKRFTHVWGSSAHAWASVVAAYLLGLGLGAWIAGRRADRTARPLRAYALCELGVAASALAIPFAIRALFDATAGIYTALGEAPLAFGLVRFLITFAVLVVPTALMGATLPLLVRHFAAEGVALGRAVAWLYALNALGAAAGAWFTGMVLLPELGLARANFAAAALSAVVGAAAWSLGRAPSAARELASPPPTPLAWQPRRGAVYAAAALSGAAALALQMLWARDLVLVLGGTTYAYTVVLAVFILGLGLGSLAFRVFFARLADLRVVAAALVLAVVAATLAGDTLLPGLALLAGAVRDQRVDPAFNSVACAVAGLAVEGVATFAMGALFPLLVRLAEGDAARAGRAVGLIYAWNTVGSIPAAIATHLVLMPQLGAAGSYRLALALYVAALAALLLDDARRSRPALAMAGLAAAALVFLPRPRDPLDLNLGNYMYGMEVEHVRDVLRPLYFCTGATANVLVTSEFEDVLPDDPRASRHKRTLIVNGKIDATSTVDMANQLAIAYFPRFVRPKARDVLVIGMGSGTTAGASLLFPGARVTCCEIEPAIVRAAGFFSAVNHLPPEPKDFRVVLEDGRSFVQGTQQTFDLILSEPSNPWVAGVANLFTREFYEAARARLAPGGVLAQWCQTYALSVADYALVVRTLAAVFPQVVLVRVSDVDTVLLASAAPILPDQATVAESQALIDALPPVRADLRRWLGTESLRGLLLAHVVLDNRGVQRFLAAQGDGAQHTDMDLRLEYDSPRFLFGQPPDAGLRVDQALLAAVDVGLQRDLVTRLGADRELLPALRAWESQFQSAGRRNAVIQMIELGLLVDPDDPELLGDQMLYDPAVDPQQNEQRIAHLIELSPEQAFRVGRTLAQSGSPIQALPIFEKLVERFPQSSNAWAGLGAVYGSLSRIEDSRTAIGKALALDPFDELARNLEQALKATR